jgi:ABC-type uncharacterized transport system involved in gliding motility auxiliary subunit
MRWIESRQTKFITYAVVYTLIVVAVLALINFLANRYNRSYDATSNKRFSLADQSIKVVRELKADARISYWDKASEFQRARDLLDRYDTLSPKLSVEYLDPDKKPQLAKAAGVKTYGTIFVEAAGRKEEAKSLSEEEVTGALVRALKGGKRMVCFLAGDGERSLEETGPGGYSGLKTTIEKNNYETKTIRPGERTEEAAEKKKVEIGKTEAAPAGKVEIPSDCTVTVVAGPKNDLGQPVIDALKASVEAGGRLLFLLDPPLRLGRDETAENAALVKVLEEWGVTVNKDLVVDASGIGQVFGLSEVVPIVSNYETHPIGRELKGTATALPLARTLEVKSGGKATVEKLFSTSKNSFASTNLSSPELEIDPAKAKRGPLVLGAAGTVKGAKEGRFVVIGSSGFAANNLLGFNANRDLMLNTLNWLSSDEDLISIRPKEPEDRRLTLTGRQMNLVFWWSVVVFPLLIVVAGVGVWWRRR